MASIRKKLTLEIVNGPKLSLITNSLLCAFLRKRVFADFQTANNTYSTIITGITRPTQTTLKLTGKIDTERSLNHQQSNPNTNFSGEYSTKSKTGRFTFYIDYNVPGATINDDDIKRANQFVAEFDAPRNNTT